MSYAKIGEWLECTRAEWLRRPHLHGLATTLAQTGGLTQTGDRLRLRLFPEEPFGFEPEWTELEALYEDEFCLVVAKPAGMSVHPAAPGERGTLANAVAFHYQAQGERTAVRHVHRLDKDTTGPVLYAKGKWATARLDEAMRGKQVRRVYLALAEGRLERASGTLSFPIGKDRHRSNKRRVSPGGQPAVTHYRVVRQFADAALVRLELETGRTHQIRVHMSHIGHPLVGDEAYGGSAKPFGRQALHGAELAFPHPWTGEPVRVECPLPDDFAALLDRHS